MVPEVLRFEDMELHVIERNGEVWLRNDEIAKALEYADADAINRIYARNADEFTDEMTCTVKLTVQGQLRDVRVFSLRGAHLVGMFARTERAKEFRRWVLDVLDGIEPPLRDTASTMPTSVSHRADHIVSATRSFNGLLRAAQGLKLGHARAARSANEATRRYTGVDLLEELGVTEEELAAAEAPSRGRALASTNDDGTAARVAAWLDAPEQVDVEAFTSDDILVGALGIAPGHRDFRSMQTRLGFVMARLGWNKARIGSGPPTSRRWMYVRP